MMAAMAEITLAEVPPGHGVISKLEADAGDFRITWDPDDAEEVANAREAFNDLRNRQGYTVYKVEGTGRRSRREVIRDFDPALGAMQLVAVRPNAGG